MASAIFPAVEPESGVFPQLQQLREEITADLVLREGRLLEAGSHAELTNADGLYSELVRIQDGRPSPPARASVGAMLEAKRASAWKRSYDIIAEGRRLATWDPSSWKAGGTVELNGRRYEIRANMSGRCRGHLSRPDEPAGPGPVRPRLRGRGKISLRSGPRR